MALNKILSLLLLAAVSFAAQSRAKTVQDRVEQYEKQVKDRLKPYFAAAAVEYPPSRLTLIALKQERVLQLYVATTNGTNRLLRNYPILAASGRLGPKLREGDQQVPEGLYRIDTLNPNSAFHLSLRVNYPNEFDRAQARAEGRTKLGGDIMIHGNAVSIGCIAVGDEASEDIFVLAARTGLRNIKVISSPVDFRLRGLPAPKAPVPEWVASLYRAISSELAHYPLNQDSGSSLRPSQAEKRHLKAR